MSLPETSFRIGWEPVGAVAGGPRLIADMGGAENMRIARALALSPLVPLLGIAVVGIGLGYRSVFGLGEFVLLWAIFLYPLVAVLMLGFYLFSRWRGLTARRHFAIGGLLGGAILALSWWWPFQPADGSSHVLPAIVFCAVGGVVGAATTVSFWQLAFSTRAAASR